MARSNPVIVSKRDKAVAAVTFDVDRDHQLSNMSPLGFVSSTDDLALEVFENVDVYAETDVLGNAIGLWIAPTASSDFYTRKDEIAELVKVWAARAALMCQD